MTYLALPDWRVAPAAVFDIQAALKAVIHPRYVGLDVGALNTQQEHAALWGLPIALLATAEAGLDSTALKMETIATDDVAGTRQATATAAAAAAEVVRRRRVRVLLHRQQRRPLLGGAG